MSRMQMNLLFSAALLGAAACLPVARADVRVIERTYVYYPEHEMYFAPDRNVWYWMDDGRWSEGAVLPAYYQQYTRNGVRIMLAEERPFVQHTYVVRQYGGGRHPDDPKKGRGHKKHKHKHKHHD